MARDMKPPEHIEERRLVALMGLDGKPEEKRKRATVIDKLLAFTDDGYVVHVPTGFFINAPSGPDGAQRPDCVNDRKFILWMLEQDPDGWESSRNYKLGERLTPALATRLNRTRNSYPGD